MLQKQTSTKSSASLYKQKSYTEVIEFLDNQWNISRTGLEQMRKLDKALGSVSKKINTILIGGTNGKSLTAYFTARLLKEEGLSVATLSAPHILTYNERLTINNEPISNKLFAEIANEVMAAAHDADIIPHAQEILTAMALVYANKQKVDVALLEVSGTKTWDPSKICDAKVAAITRVTQNHSDASLEDTIKNMLDIVGKNSWFLSADQSKLSLQVMLDHIKEHGGQWAMPIRKLAALPYPFEQLHGRCAALAERIAHIYMNSFIATKETVVQDSLLIKQKGQRGRPTLEAKRQSELNPKRTVENFWQEIYPSLSGRFQLLEKEKPTLLLDNAQNIDAFENLLLGIRLLHYKRPLKGFALIIGSDAPYLENPEFAKLVRYFFKKTSGNLTFCPVTPAAFSSTAAMDINKAAEEAKNVKVKAKVAKDFKDAFESACKMVDERNGLVVIAGSDAILNEYWKYKGIKKL